MYAPFAPFSTTTHCKAISLETFGHAGQWSPLAEPQRGLAQGPTNPVEMVCAACVATGSRSAYRRLFETVWGADSFSSGGRPTSNKCARLLTTSHERPISRSSQPRIRPAWIGV
jgi:hypothetical protein